MYTSYDASMRTKNFFHALTIALDKIFPNCEKFLKMVLQFFERCVQIVIMFVVHNVEDVRDESFCESRLKKRESQKRNVTMVCTMNLGWLPDRDWLADLPSRTAGK